MKRIQRFVTLLAVLSMAVFCIPAFVNAASFEMLKYDFEDDVKPICGAAFALNDTVSYSGVKALKFDPNAADNWGLQIEPALTVGDEYTFAAKIKTVNFKNNGAAWQFWAQQAGAGNKEFSDGTNDWEWYTMTFTAQDIANHKFGIFSFGSGTPEGLIYIDDIAFGLKADVAAFMAATDEAAAGKYTYDMIKYDFEDDVKPSCGAAFALNDTESYSGKKALKFDPNAADNWGLQIVPSPALKAGMKYTFAAKIKTVDFKNNGAAWQFWAQQAGAGNKEFADGSNDWTWYTMTFTAQDIANHKFGFFSFGSGTPEGLIYIDDIALGLEADVAAFMTATDAAATEPEPTDPDDESSFMAFDMEDETKLPLTSFDRVSTESYKGQYSLLFDPAAKQHWGLEMLPKVVPGKTYTFGAMLKTDGYADNGREWMLWAQQPAAGNVYIEDGTKDWTWYSMTFTAEDINNHKFGIYAFGPQLLVPDGKFYVDNIVFGLKEDVDAYYKELTGETVPTGSTTTIPTKPNATTTTTTGDASPTTGSGTVLPIVIVSLVSGAILAMTRKSRKHG